MQRLISRQRKKKGRALKERQKWLQRGCIQNLLVENAAYSIFPFYPIEVEALTARIRIELCGPASLSICTMTSKLDGERRDSQTLVDVILSS